MFDTIFLGKRKPLQLQDMVYIMQAEVTDLEHTAITIMLGCYTEKLIYGKILVFSDRTRIFELNFDQSGNFYSIDDCIPIYRQYLENIRVYYNISSMGVEYLMTDWDQKKKFAFAIMHPEIFDLVKLRRKKK